MGNTKMLRKQRRSQRSGQDPGGTDAQSSSLADASATAPPAPPDSEPPATALTLDPSAEIARLATEALHRFADAERLEKTPPSDLCSNILNRHAARRERELIPGLLDPGPVVAAAGEAIPALGFHETSGKRDTLVDTLERPTRISVSASEQRMSLLEQAGVLHAGVDVVATIEAKNSVEKMLAHQMAAAHKAAMTLVAQMSAAGLGPTTPEMTALVARTGNTAARLMDVCANTALTIQRLRTGGTQRVVVQHRSSCLPTRCQG